MKKVFCAFDFVFVTFLSDVVSENCILSDKQDDLIFVVCDEDTTEQQFHTLYEAFLKRFTRCTQLCTDFVTSQRKFFLTDEDMNARHQSIIESMKHELIRATDETQFTKY